MPSYLEIRGYNLKPGTREQFHQLMANRAHPLLTQWAIDVVNFGPSAHDQNSYFLIRAYPSLQVLESSEDAFYSSAEWQDGPREAILACIESYTTVVIPVDEVSLQGLRR